MVYIERSCHQKILMWNIKALTLTVQKLLARLKFSKNRSNSKAKVTESKIMATQKGLITGNIHVKYQNSNTHCSKSISKIKVFKKWVKLQGQGNKVKNYGLITGNFHVKYKSSCTHCSKVISKVKVSERRTGW